MDAACDIKSQSFSVSMTNLIVIPLTYNLSDIHLGELFIYEQVPENRMLIPGALQYDGVA